jgi:hypothetical protein
VFISSADCVERHCMWEGDSCKEKKCDMIATALDCEEFGNCFWVEGNETLNVNPKCVIQVFMKKLCICVL